MQGERAVFGETEDWDIVDCPVTVITEKSVLPNFVSITDIFF